MRTGAAPVVAGRGSDSLFAVPVLVAVATADGGGLLAASPETTRLVTYDFSTQEC